MDFMSDQLYDGRRIRILTLVDNHTRESLALSGASSWRAWNTGFDPGRQRPGVYLQGLRLLGLLEQGEVGLLSAW